MNTTNIKISKSMQILSFYLVQRMSSENACSQEDALKRILKTMTYELLQDRETGLYAESPEYIWNMLEDEEKGNIESWLKD